MSVPAHDLAALGVRGGAPGPALVHGVPDVVVDPEGDAWRHRRSGARVSVLMSPSRSSSPARALALAGLIDQGCRGGRGRPRSRGWPIVGVPWACAPGADERIISTKASQRRWSQGVSPSEGTAAGPGLEAGPGLGEGLGGQLHAHGATRLVEAQVTTVVLGARRGRGGGGGGAACGRRRPARARCTPGPASQSSWSLSGVATSATARTLSKDRSPAQSDPTRCGRSQAFSPRRVSARAVGRRDPEALHGPGLGRRRPVVSVHLAPARPRPGTRRSSPSAAAFCRKSPIEIAR